MLSVWQMTLGPEMLTESPETHALRVSATLAYLIRGWDRTLKEKNHIKSSFAFTESMAGMAEQDQEQKHTQISSRGAGTIILQCKSEHTRLDINYKSIMRCSGGSYG